MGNLRLVIANKINDLPLALGNVVSDFETMDMLTPSRLRLGRNNNRKKRFSKLIKTFSIHSLRIGYFYMYQTSCISQSEFGLNKI